MKLEEVEAILGREADWTGHYHFREVDSLRCWSSNRATIDVSFNYSNEVVGSCFSTPICEEKALKIKFGMKMAEVEAILGRKGRIESCFGTIGFGIPMHTWHRGDATISIGFSDFGAGEVYRITYRSSEKWWVRTFNRHFITCENYKKVNLGMTKREVENLFGARPGSYFTEPRRAFTGLMGGIWLDRPCDAWISDELGVFIWFNDDGKVMSANCIHNCSGG